INRFFQIATGVFVQHDAIIDQLVGDEAIGLFVPGYAGPAHARRAIDAAQVLVKAMDPQAGGAIDLPIGVGVHSGVVFIGSVGAADSFTDFTALGDAVNTAARLASSARAGEILISEATREAAEIGLHNLERRVLDLKGKAAPFEAFSVHTGRH